MDSPLPILHDSYLRDLNIPWTDHFPTYPSPILDGSLFLDDQDFPPLTRRRRSTLENSSTSNKRARVDDDDDNTVFRLQLPEVDAASGDDCAICLQDLEPAPEEATRAMPCSHAFHECCIFQWLRWNPVCPICRRPLRPQQHLDVDDEDPLQLSTPLPQEQDVDDDDPPQWLSPLPMPVPQEQDVDDDDWLEWPTPVRREQGVNYDDWLQWPTPVRREQGVNYDVLLQLPLRLPSPLPLPPPVPREQYVYDDDRLQLTMPVPREMLEIEVL